MLSILILFWCCTAACSSPYGNMPTLVADYAPHTHQPCTSILAQDNISCRVSCAPISTREANLSSCHGTSDHCNPYTMSAAQLRFHFNVHQWTEAQILDNPLWYMSESYLVIAKQLPSYADYVRKFYEEYSNYDWRDKFRSWRHSTYISGLADTFIKLHQDCETQRKEKLRQQEIARREREQQYQRELTTTALNGSGEDRYHTRYRVMRATDNKRVQRPAYPLSHEAQRFAQEYGIVDQFNKPGAMNPYEYQLHSEFGEQLTAGAQLKLLYKDRHECAVFLDALGHGIAIGVAANTQQHPEMATQWADYGWKVLDIIKAAGEGCALGVHNTVEMFLHPVATAQAVLCGAATIVGFLGSATQTVLCASVYPSDYNLAALDELTDRLDAVTTQCIKALAQLSARDAVKYATAFAIDMVLPVKILHAASTICSRLKPIVITAIKVLREEQQVTAISGVGMIPIESGKLVQLRQMFSVNPEIIQEAEQVAVEVLEVAERVPQAVTESSIIREVQETGIIIGETVHSKVIRLQEFHAQFMQDLKPAIAALEPLFDNKVKGFGECANKYIKIHYEHILGMELLFNKKLVAKLSGFHHDFKNFVEKSGFIAFVNKVVGKCGEYKTNLIINGREFRYKTFFPAHWSQERVVEAIYEAYSNPISCELAKDGKYLLTGCSNEGMIIEMYITKNAEITTAYPVIGGLWNL